MSEAVSRRDFLKIAGVAGATIGVGAGLGGLVAACGGDEATTTTAAAATTTTGAAATTTTGAAGSTTTVSAAVEEGREIKLGFVGPLTGPLASFGAADKYCLDHFNEVIGAGVVCGDGKMHKITTTIQDSQSSSNRASQVAGDLIQNTKVDILMAASSADNVIPVSDQAEAFEVPCISTDTPWQAWFMGRKRRSQGRFQVDLSCLLGSGRQLRHLLRPVDAGTEQQDRRGAVAQRRGWQQLPLPVARPYDRRPATRSWTGAPSRTGPRTSRR